MNEKGEASPLRRLPGGIWTLGFASLFMDSSSELIHSLMPVFLSTVLGASMATIGVIEGVAEATAAITKVFSGAFSDRLRNRKLPTVLGYGLAALTKPIFPLANSIGLVFTARFVDRIGKGIRGAPRDALVADITPPALLGAAFGLRQALDSVGAFLGPVLAVAGMMWFADDVRSVLWLAVAPAFVAVLLLMLFLREPEKKSASLKPPPTLADTRRLPASFWLVVVLGMVFNLARFSEAFLVLRAKDVGLSIGHVPLIMIVMNVVYAAAAYPAGVAADKITSRLLLMVGLIFLIAADVFLAVAVSPAFAYAGAALWGLHLALTQGLFSKLVADAAPAELRGTAFGVFNLAGGCALLLASALAGVLWGRFGPRATFLTGAAFAALAAAGLLFPSTPAPRTRNA